MSESPKVNKKQVGVGLENNPEREEASNNNNQEEEEEVSPKEKQRSYRGIRPRGYKWVSEIREPRKVTKIWLGTWPAAEKAAAAYDAAALALRGDEAVLNFPEDVYRYPRPSSSSHDDIRNAAAAAAAMRNDTPEAAATTTAAIIDETQQAQAQAQAQEQAEAEAVVQEYIDMEVELNMPNLLFHMAGAMMLSPPPFLCSTTTDSYVGEIGSLWSYE